MKDAFPNKSGTIGPLLISGTFTVALIIISVIRAQGIFFPTDEFRYWSNAANMLGIDWSAVTASMNSYAPGYSLLLLPLMALCKTPVIMYRAALLLNALLVILAACLLVRLIGILCGRIRLWVLPCLLFPAYLIYMSYTISEVLLYVLFLELCCLMLKISRAEKKAGLIGLGLLLSVLMILVHHRTVGVAVFFALTCLLCAGKRPRPSDRKILLLSVTVLCLLLAAMILYSFTGGRISTKEYTPGLAVDFLLGIAGKIFYLGASSFGIAIVGLIVAFRKRSEPFFLFYVTSFAYMVLLSSFFFCGGTRMDQLMYGRYEEMFIPLLLYIGAEEMRNGTPKAETGISSSRVCVILVMGVTALVLTLYVSFIGKTEYVADFVNGIDWMFGTGMPKVSQIYIRPFLIASAGFLVLDRLLPEEKKEKICIFCLTAVFLFSAAFLSRKHVWLYQKADISDRQVAESALTLAGDGREVIFLNSPYNDYMNLLQFWFGDKPLRMTEGLDPEAFQTSPDAVVITYKNYECEDQLLARYNEHISSAHFEMYRNK